MAHRGICFLMSAKRLEKRGELILIFVALRGGVRAVDDVGCPRQVVEARAVARARLLAVTGGEVTAHAQRVAASLVFTQKVKIFRLYEGNNTLISWQSTSDIR